MARDYLTLPSNEVRRKDRQREEDSWIREFLGKAAIGTLATVHNGQPFINSNLFVYEPEKHVIYMHTAATGRTRANVSQAQKICFSVSEMGRLLPAEEAMHFSVEYCGVVVFGTARIIEDDLEGKYAMDLLLKKYFSHLQPHKDYRPTVSEELRKTTVYQIDIDRWSGKEKKVADDFPGAFYYNER